MDLRELARDEKPERFAAAVLPWIHEAGNPYFDWIFGEQASARHVLEHWIRRPSSEISVRRVVALFLEERPVGGFIAFCMDELLHCRKADLLALLSSDLERAALLGRLEAVRDLFAPGEPDDYYLSKIGLLVECRGRGLGRALLEACARRGAEGGFGRLRLELSSDNARASRFYERAGFQEIEKRRSTETGIEYRTLVRSLR